MFCRPCEQLLSRDEDAFSRHLFGYEYELNSEPIGYEEWLLRFASGLMLRVCVVNLYFTRDDDRGVVEPLTRRCRRLLEGAYEDFRSYLTGDSAWPGKLQPLQISVGFRTIPRDGEIKSAWDFYMARGVDSGIVLGDEMLAVYAHLPFHVFWTGVDPKKVRSGDWRNCRIKKRGTLDPQARQRAPEQFWGYIDWRLMVTTVGFEAAQDATRRFREESGRRPPGATDTMQEWHGE